jgi:hypothetical protein
MATLPPAIFFINGDITYPPTGPVYIGAQPNNVHSDASVSELTNLQIQLFINDTMTKTEFDARVAADPNYPTIVHLQNLRILVILPDFQDGYNRQYADVVMFLHQGLADIEKNNFGPPFQNFPIQRLTIYELLRAAGSPNVVILPWNISGSVCGTCNYPFYCDACHTFSGISTCYKCGCSCKCGCDCGLYDQQGVKSTALHLPNCENEYNNNDFINRK